MTRISFHPVLILLAASGMILAQVPAPQPPPASAGGWRKIADPAPVPVAAQAQTSAAEQQDPTQPVERDAFGQPQRPTPPPAVRPSYGLPAQVTVKAGTFVNVRIDEKLASNHNQPGDTFTGTLAQPIVVDGVVVAQRGQSVYGRVAQADKVKGISHLGIELTGLTLADGSQVSAHSQLVSRRGGTVPAGQQAGTIVGTTALGTVVGAAADWGRGAAIGAGAGAAAGTIGVLVTRNRPSVIYPETMLTFEMGAPLTIHTANAPQAWRYVGPEDYDRPAMQVVQRPLAPRPAYYYGPSYYPYYPYFGGPGISFGIGGFFRGSRGGFRRWR